MGRFAVIDLGTNTFHLLVVESNEAGNFTEIYRERRFVKLGEGGLQSISKAAFDRGLETLLSFASTLRQYGPCPVRAFGTAALRTAANGPDFIAEVKARTGIAVELISGDREAALIHQGVAGAVPFNTQHHLIMDVGGGSVEFIIANAEKVFWAGSFPVGLAVLFHRFHQSDPISSNETTSLRRFLARELAPLHTALKQYPAQTLVGASGIFDVIEELLVPTKAHQLFSQLPAHHLRPLFERIIPTTLAQRQQMAEVPAERADMIVVAFLLIDYLIRKAGMQTITISAYAMKEGMLFEMMEERKKTEELKS